MTRKGVLKLLEDIHRYYRNRFPILDADDAARTADIWQKVLVKVSDEDGPEALTAYLRDPECCRFPPQGSDIIVQTRRLHAITEDHCVSCGKSLRGADRHQGGVDDYGHRTCERCYIAEHGGPCDKSLAAGLEALHLTGQLKSVDEAPAVVVATVAGLAP